MRVASDGTVQVAGNPVPTIDGAVATCKGSGEVLLDVAGDAPFGVVDDLRKALETAGLTVRDAR